MKKLSKGVRFFSILASLAILSLGSVGFAHADTLTLLDSVSGNPVYNGVYVGPYPIQVGTNGPTMDLICDDYGTEISQGYSWSATAYSGSLIGNLKFAGALGSNATTAYEEVFFLAAEMLAPSNSSYTGAIHYALWSFLDSATPSVGSDPNSPASSAYWVALAQKDYSMVASHLDDFTVYTPDVLSGPGTSQEFIGVHGSPVPISPSFLLLGSGLFGLIGLRKRTTK